MIQNKIFFDCSMYNSMPTINKISKLAVTGLAKTGLCKSTYHNIQWKDLPQTQELTKTRALTTM